MNQEVAGKIAPAQPVASPTLAGCSSDALTDALLFLAAFHGRAVTRNALLAGLPVVDDRLSVDLLGRAARRAGLHVELVNRSIQDIPPLVLPAVLVGRDQSARILTAIDVGRQRLTLVDPTTREQVEIWMSAPEIDDFGSVFFIRPAAASDRRIDAKAHSNNAAVRAPATP